MIVNKVPGQSRFPVSTHHFTNSPAFLKCYVSAGAKYSFFVRREGITWWAVSAFSSYLFSTTESGACRGTDILLLTIILEQNQSHHF